MVTNQWITPALGLCVVAAMTLGHRHASAQNNEARAKREFERGYADLQAERYESALAHYERSYELVPRPRTVFNIALCEEALGRDEAALRHFTQFVREAERRDAEFVGFARERISALQNELMGRVIVASDPPGADVFIDGERQPRGRTPLVVALEPGEHRVRVSLAGAPHVDRRVDVAPRERTRLAVELALPAAITIVVEPGDATIYGADGRKLGRGIYKAAVAPGPHRFDIRRAGYAPETIVLEAKRGGTHEQRVDLERVTAEAQLVVRGDAGLTIRVDDETVATTSGADPAILSVRPGEHELVVEQAGRRSWRTTMHWSPGEIIEVEPSLREDRGRRWLTGSLGGVGVASLGGAATLGILGLRDVAHPDPSRHARGKRRALAADGLFVVGVATLIAVWRLARRPGSSADVRRSHSGRIP